MVKKKSFIFGVLGSLLIIGFLFTLNFLTSWGHPWFIYPAFVVIWWPLSLYFAENKNWKMFAVSGSIVISIFFVLVNLITSPSFPWAIFPIFAVVWWPLSMILCGIKKYKLFSIVSSILTIIFFFIINMIVSRNVIWFIYPAFAIIWWPLSMILCEAKKYKLYSIVSSIYIIVFFALVNLITSPNYIWFYYPAFAIIWWPLSMIFANRKTIKIYSVVMSLLTIGFFALINLLNTPNILWFQWTIFYLLWWPVVKLLGKKARTLTFSVASSLIIIAYFVMQYIVQTPGAHPWYLYIIAPALWWPVTTALKKYAHTRWFLLGSLAVFTLYYGAINLLISPEHLWIVYLLYPFSWAVIGDYFGSRRKYFTLSIWGSIITIIFFAVVNYMTSPNHIWAVYPAFAIIWWPLSLYFFKVRNNKKEPQS